MRSDTRTATNSTKANSTQLRQLRKKVAARNGISGGNTSDRARSPLRQRTNSAPAWIDVTRSGYYGRNNDRQRLLLEDHYRVDPSDKILLPGSLANDDDWDRDLHDFFNLISLVPVVVLDVINWDWDVLLFDRRRRTRGGGIDDGNAWPRGAWTGEWFPLFYAVTVGYFVADLIWVSLVPRCVRSPGVILQHHVATLLYLIIPYRFPAETGWLMGACLSVEANTWLLIARRVFNKQGFEPYVVDLPFVSVRIKLISVLFYATWVGIRCCLYPCIWSALWTLWSARREETGAVFHQRYAGALVLHTIFCALNFKWTFDLFASKWRSLKSGKSSKVTKGLYLYGDRQHETKWTDRYTNCNTSQPYDFTVSVQ